MKVHQLINPYRNANTYLLELANNTVVLVDVGNLDVSNLLKWLRNHQKKLTHVFLTHEHGDHCCGLDVLYEQNPFVLICSPICSRNIANPKQNFSLYVEELPTFSIQLSPFQLMGDGEVILIEETTFSILHTPGHSPGGICIFVDNYVFTGDTLLNGIKSPLTFPHSSRSAYKNSLSKLKEKLREGMILYPGHDKPFTFTTFENLVV